MESPANLLTLPGELRNTIWRTVVQTDRLLDVEPLCAGSSTTKLHQPALPFTCKMLREEVLSIFYSENSFFLGKVGYHNYGDIRLYEFDLRIQRWCYKLGEQANFLTRLSMIIDGLCYAWDDGLMPGDAMYEMDTRNGSIRFEMNGRPRCLCRLRDAVEKSAVRDGRRLLDVMKEYSTCYCEAVKEGRCNQCGLSRLETFGQGRQTRQKNWDNIITC
ncbi:hypothetical protein CLAFUW4_09672 [Fulvia fulva]|uniref:Uncharacterized protein n=1 Tax=Passalora fulva TaxID=5499 RepID=A0A9Q8PFP2_PASFU|nr:uncharacterized protein CLAFUR5_09766 [Fulvia fulva]KAK4613235.1 hypothetical protein CLAFUR4_09677 [Fulvia fulva]KAK4614702.1 hypothetical protein CLAFUR0_09668 [Fulvia fulva]UJO21615.1 hypothetical protein CLAFUR5_09766 [Fulvia fulva]WPV20056.1 hypothetical protein CLAFUW4_09672 [Fulvia fulva]WPV35671.1 hypothetical protein CLAFUW7_09673 [Fulvia fulva]